VGHPVSPPLHALLRELVDRQGPGVVETAEVFRAALDDFLTEDEATTGELNLLVDAVRLGAVARLVSILDHGGDPAAAIQEAGDAMARDRGTEDTTRSRWAVAALGFALGRLDEGQVRSTPIQPSQRPAPPPTERAPGPGPVTLGDRAPERVTWDHATAPPPSPPPRPVSRRRTWPVVAAIVVLALAAGSVVGWILYDDEPGGSAQDGNAPSGTAEPSIDPTIDLPKELPSNTILISANDGENTRIYRVDADTREVEPLTSGPSDNWPTISRDREQVIFLARGTERAVLPMVLDLDTRQIRPFFGSDGACQYGRRPGWDLAGSRLALVCLTAEGEETGLFVVDPEGRELIEVEVDGTVRGSPTWVSNTDIVYSLAPGDDSPSTLWQTNVDTGETRQLTTGAEGWDSQPVWCGAKDLLLFTRSDSSVQSGELWMRTSRGFEERLPIDEPVNGPVWSPGCGQLAFTVEGDDGPVLVTAPADDPADYTPVEGIPGEITAPVWDTR
jgi:Tol biopolymer transport system component